MKKKLRVTDLLYKDLNMIDVEAIPFPRIAVSNRSFRKDHRFGFIVVNNLMLPTAVLGNGTISCPFLVLNKELLYYQCIKGWRWIKQVYYLVQGVKLILVRV